MSTKMTFFSILQKNIYEKMDDYGQYRHWTPFPTFERWFCVWY